MIIFSFFKIVTFMFAKNVYLTFFSGRLPLLTVVTPFYNEDLDFVVDCMNSLRRQFYKNIEIILVDDGSNKQISENLQLLLKSRYPLVKYIRHDVNKGLSASRNTGAKAAKGDFITFLDSDDFLLPFSLVRRMFEFSRKSTGNSAGVYGKIKPYYPQDSKFSLVRNVLYPGEGDALYFLNTNSECPFPAHSPIIKKNVFNKFGGFNEDLKNGAEDWDLWSRMMRNGYRFEYGNVFAGVYRQKKCSMVRDMAEKHLVVACSLIKKSYMLMPDSDKIIPNELVYEKGLEYYLKERTISIRSIQFLAMEYLAQGKCSKLWSFTNIEKEKLPLLW